MKQHEVHAKVRAGPRSRRQRQDTEPMVQTTPRTAYQDGLGPTDEATNPKNCFLYGRSVLHRCGLKRTETDKNGQKRTETDGNGHQ